MTTVAPATKHCALRVRGLRVEVQSGAAIVDGVDLDVARGKILGLVGESGSGKTTTGLALLGHATPGARIAGGSVEVDGHDILGVDDAARRELRGKVVSYVPQDAARALNPALRIGAVDRRRRPPAPPGQRRRASPGLLDRCRAAGDAGVRAPPAPSALRRAAAAGHDRHGAVVQPAGDRARRADHRAGRHHPGARPGGGRLAARRARRAMVYVSHDLAVVSQLADEVAVMYAGTARRAGADPEVLARPRHPYTRGLVAVDPRPQPTRAADPHARIPPSASRTARAAARSRRAARSARPTARSPFPALVQLGGSRQVRCLHHGLTPSVRTRSAEASPAAIAPPGQPRCCRVRSLRASAPRTGRRRGRGVATSRCPSRRRVPRPGRRVGQRQDDDRALHRRPAQPGVGFDRALRRAYGRYGPPDARPSSVGGCSTCSRTRTSRSTRGAASPTSWRDPVSCCVGSADACRRDEVARAARAGPATGPHRRPPPAPAVRRRAAARRPRAGAGGRPRRPDLRRDHVSARRVGAGRRPRRPGHAAGRVGLGGAADHPRPRRRRRGRRPRRSAARAGVLCESGPVAQVISDPQADYTRRLIAAAPSLSRAGSART